MRENFSSFDIYRRKVQVREEKLFKKLLEEEALTDKIRDTSRTLWVLNGWAKHADTLANGKTPDAIALAGIGAVVLIPMLLTEMDKVLAASIFSEVMGAVGNAALTEKKLPVASHTEKTVNKWIGNWVLDKNKAKIDGDDVSRVLINLPRTAAKSPEEIRKLLAEEGSKNKDPYSKVANYVHGIIVVEKGGLKSKQKEEKEIDETVRVMLEGQIKTQQEQRKKKYITREAIRMGLNGSLGAGVGALATFALIHFIGPFWAGPLGALDDFWVFGNKYVRWAYNRRGQILNKITGFGSSGQSSLEASAKLQEKTEKANTSSSSSK